MGKINEMQVVSDNTIIVTGAIREMLVKITDNHEFVSLIPTPKAFIKQKWR